MRYPLNRGAPMSVLDIRAASDSSRKKTRSIPVVLLTVASAEEAVVNGSASYIRSIRNRSHTRRRNLPFCSRLPPFT
ncbi:hypothetical protein VNO78_02240 [Psophocarpus tetragonolobus]|uniref:Uncharacterized protein n=1 Tax=Psophocarpus tetragonolobus TaxID=3891 RepID=A0AAN9T189_PSOTE